MKRRFQNKLAESTITLPAACVVATLLWWLPQGEYSTPYMHAWLACAVLTYFTIEIANANALIRVRSQMPAAILLFVMAACGFLHDRHPQLLAALALTIAIYCILKTPAPSSSSEDTNASRTARRPQMHTFHAYAALSLGSIEWPPLLLLTIPLLWSQALYLRSMSWRSLGAAFIGCVTPYFFWATFVLASTAISYTPITESSVTTLNAEAQHQPTGAVLSGLPTETATALTLDNFIRHTKAIVTPITHPITNTHPIFTIIEQYSQSHQTKPTSTSVCSAFFPPSLFTIDNTPRLTALALLILLAITGFVHYTHRNYDDKIRVRICHHTFIATQLTITLWLALQPQLFLWLFPLLLISTVPSAAHFVALTRTWATNAWVIILTLLLLATAILNLIPNSINHISNVASRIATLM